MDEATSREGGGKEASRKRSSPGALPRLSDDQQRARLPGLLQEGAVRHGFRGEVWTCQRVAQLITREFGVDYHPAHVSRILKRPGFSSQKPDRLADQRDEGALEERKEKPGRN